jgi:hypothetical protein
MTNILQRFRFTLLSSLQECNRILVTVHGIFATYFAIRCLQLKIYIRNSKEFFARRNWRKSKKKNLQEILKILANKNVTAKMSSNAKCLWQLQYRRKYSCGFPQNVEFSIFVTILQEEIENWRRRVMVKGINAVIGSQSQRSEYRPWSASS